ncbi:MAG TPA: 1-acyl-sn-glycerol-3-phosphate acyltransferase [Burkholderiaceae bacterium]|nr:1-acyl-sn-glycerol-3-phosphate acyltransferase [Burkholderiaceae bacterium]
MDDAQLTAPAPNESEGPQLLAQRPVQLRGSPLARACLRLGGWHLDFDGLPARQGVIAVYPHTSNWDFVVGILAKWAMGIPVTFWAKDSLFRVPLLGRWLSWLGGVPVDRSAPGGLVGDMVQRMRAARDEGRFLWLVVAPEGTRSRGLGWRSGFYRVAVGADVPVGLAHLDFGRRRVGVTAYFRFGGDRVRDMQAAAHHLAAVRGLRHDLASPVQLGES